MHDQGPNADHRFVGYYAEQSSSDQTRQRFEGVRRVVLQLRTELGLSIGALDVMDVGCGAGPQTLMWAAAGHRVRGVDISAPLIELARKRALERTLPAEFFVASATRLPFADSSCDIVLVSELLEHLTDWEPCVNETVRVLRPGGVLYFSTTNRLCPKQQEFSLPAYSWYPTFLKKKCESMAITTHRHWVQYASYPAVHWFSFYQLQDYLNARGVVARDRFDVMDTTGSVLKLSIVQAIRTSRALRFAAHVLTPYTLLVGFRPQ